MSNRRLRKSKQSYLYKSGPDIDTTSANKKYQLPYKVAEAIDSGTITDFGDFFRFKQIATNREDLYNVYDDMQRDTTIATALDLYAEDATLVDDLGRVMWIESENPTIVTAAERLLDVLNLKDNAYYYIKSLITYGDLYIELFYDKELSVSPSGEKKVVLNENMPIEDKYKTVIAENTLAISQPYNDETSIQEYIEKYDNPANLFTVRAKGKIAGFIQVPEVKTNRSNPDKNYRSSVSNRYDIQDITAHAPDKFVHICLNNTTERFPEKMTITTTDDLGVVVGYEYKVNRGQSILNDVYRIYQELNLLEDSLILNRITKSALVRLLQVEVGDMPRNEVNSLLRRIKQMIEQKTVANTSTGEFRSVPNTPPMENNVYIPTKGGKGAISTSIIGGDVDVKSIVDVTYFRDKLAGGLKIPKQFLGLTDDAAGFNGGSSLTKLDSRYARSVRRIQQAYCNGVRDILNIFFIRRGQEDFANNFTVKMTSPSTIEDSERAATLETNASIVNNVIGIVSTILPEDPDASFEVGREIINSLLNLPYIDEILKKYSPDEKAKRGESSEVGEEEVSRIQDDLISKYGNSHPGSKSSSDMEEFIPTTNSEIDTDIDSGDFVFPQNAEDIDIDLTDNSGEV